MPVHIGDYKRDTGHLRAAGHGAYLLLLFHHWSTGDLPDDDEQLAAIACMTRGEWKKMRPILERFFGPGWRHGRVEKDLASAKQSYEARAKAGEKGGKAKAENKQSSSIATALPEQPLTLDQDKKEDTAGAVTAKVYAFEDGVIRLNQRDLDGWALAYSHLDLRAELLSLSKWAETEGSNWFHAVKGALAKRNREVKAKAARAETNTEFKWNGKIPGVI
jgi:uncharacterized protein YdaU (DUF1376 family)